jgi:uncharacterized iron-regulated protein
LKAHVEAQGTRHRARDGAPITLRALVFVVALLVAACTASGLKLADHPLAGRIWDTHAQRFVTEDEARERVAAADVALLGETHDNPVHHQIQARLLAASAARLPKPALAMEQVDLEWQHAVDEARAVTATPASIATAGHVSEGWQWPMYEPLVAFALAHDLPIVAANYSRSRSKAVVAGGIAALPPGEAERLALEPVWTPDRNARMRRILVEGHCGQDDPIIDKILEVQRVRDALMADAILSHPRTVAIIGRGHARADLGVPLYLAQRAPARRVVSVGLVEVESDKPRPQDYEDTGAGVHDLVFFTSRASRSDPCADFRKIRR